MDNLLEKFGLREFRHPQDLIVKAAIDKKDLFILLPTGHGKSLTFQYPAFACKTGCTLVISPLLALIESQVASLKQKGFSATAISSNSSKKHRTQVLNSLSSGFITYKLIYVTPELCCSEGFAPLLDTIVARGHLNRVVIDEAHCAVEWSQFRPEYARLGLFKEKYPQIPISALTGTASPLMRDQILETLKLSGPTLKKYTLGVNRPNMHLQVKYFESYDEKLQQLANQIRGYREKIKQAAMAGLCSEAAPYPGCGIIYCRRRATAEEIAEFLQSHNVNAHPYHAQLKPKEKQTVMQKWIEGDPNYAVIVATVAFGMGIDKPDTRFVIHFELPGNIESFVQQCGRAGRDNRACACTIYFTHSEKHTILTLATQSDNENVLKSAQALIDYCQMIQCRHLTLSQYFDDVSSGNTCQDICDVCNDPDSVRKMWQDWSQSAE